MIVKGRSRSNGAQLGPYLLHSEGTENVTVLQVSGMATKDVCQALIEMQEITDCGQRGVKGLYHGVISPQPGYALDERQWIYAADVLARELQLEGQPRVIVLHDKADARGQARTHAHVVFQRTDKESLKLIPDSWNYIAHERASRHLERTLGHELVPGAHIAPRKDREEGKAYPDHERLKAGMTRGKRVNQITGLYRGADSASAFVAALHDKGYVLAQGDRRDFVLVDDRAQVFSLPRFIEGVKTKQVREFMQPFAGEMLPSVEIAKAAQRDKGARGRGG